MTTTINASTTAGLVQTADTSGLLALQTAGVTAVTVNASQNVGIGETNPTQILHMKGSSTTYALAETTGTGTSSGFRMKAGAGTDFTLFTTQGGNQFGIYNNTTSTQPLTINANGALALLGASTSATGVGITFPATQSASTDANTLDDYEEGTFTPVLTGTGGGTATYSTQVGRYRKIGSFVCVWARVDLATVGTLNGYITVDNLPFASQNATNYYSIGTLLLENTTFTGSPASFMNPNSTNAYLLLSVSGATVGFIGNGNITSSTSVTICICYHTA